MSAIEAAVSGLSGLNYGAGTGGVAPAPRGDAPLGAVRPLGEDQATLSAAAKAAAWKGALDQLQATLGKIKAGGGEVGKTRKAIDDILAPVRAAAKGGPISNVQGFTVSDIAEGIAKVRVVGADLKPGESAALNVEVTQSAQTGALLLSFGGANLNLVGTGAQNPSERFVIEIAGTVGTQELSFSSGTQLTTIVDTINTFTEVTGVIASVEGTGVRLESSAYGNDAFASVKVLEDGGAVGDGVYTYRGDDNSTPDIGAGSTSFESAQNRVTDFGQTLRAIVDGQEYEGNGLRLRSVNSSIDAILLLEEWRAQTLGSFVAGVVHAPPEVAQGAIGSSSPGVDVVG